MPAKRKAGGEKRAAKARKDGGQKGGRAREVDSDDGADEVRDDMAFEDAFGDEVDEEEVVAASGDAGAAGGAAAADDDDIDDKRGVRREASRVRRRAPKPRR